MTDEPTLVEVACDASALMGLTEPEGVPTALLQPGTGLTISMDPGSVEIAGVAIDTGDEGALISVYNAGSESAVVKIATSWNEANGRHNVHACAWLGTEEMLAKKAGEGQGPNPTPGAEGEMKPFYARYVWNGELVTLEPVP